MFQRFSDDAVPRFDPKRLAALRKQMRENALDGFLVPSDGPWLGNGKAPADRRLAWVSGFTGSTGLLVALGDNARLFVDGRYTVQAKREVDGSLISVDSLEMDRISGFVANGRTDGSTVSVGYDARLHSRSWINRFRKAIEAGEANCSLRPCDNLIDRVWTDRPKRSVRPMTPYPEERAGASSHGKRAGIAKAIRKLGCKHALVTSPDSIAWLLNTRGADIDNVPVTEAMAVVADDASVMLFMNEAKADNDLRAHLGPEIVIQPLEALDDFVRNLAGPVLVDPERTSDWLTSLASESGAKLVTKRDPIGFAKAIKNETELRGIERAHARDGAACVEFLSWLSAAEGDQTLSEIELVTRLEGCRRATNKLKDIAFDTICGAGPNGAIIHYRVTEATNRQIGRNDIIVLDSGGQYEDGTTDVTRTLATGTPSRDAIQAYTLVLKGMIAMSRLRWPAGLAGCHIDAIARAPLWTRGLDYEHGTGHGVGAYLDVHEGPQAISRRSNVPLVAGMVVSNEPGYYRTDGFGIRIENLLAVQECEAVSGERDMLEFRTLTLVPLEHRLIDPSMLQRDEIEWIDSYHATVFERLVPLCTLETASWLEHACRRIGDVAQTPG